MARACIALGSNLGDRARHIERAREALAALPGTSIEAFSSVHETEPVGPAGQDRYLNAAALLETELSPEDLMADLQAIERAAGRTDAMRRVKWGPRTLDLDLLLYDRIVLDRPGLTIPHPHMHERTFVLRPLAEIAPHVVHSVLGKTIADLLSALESRCATP